MNTRFVVGIGELLFDVFPTGKKLGGAPVNFAYHVAQAGVESLAISAVGNDELGDEIMALVAENGVNNRVARVDAPTGTVQVTLDSRGVPNFEICEDVAWDKIPLSDEILALVANCKAFCFGTLAQRSRTSRQTINALLDVIPSGGDALVIYDINLRQHFYSKEIIETSLRKSNVLKINDDEYLVVADMLGLPANDYKTGCMMLIERYELKMVVLTCGEKGSYIYTHTEVSYMETPKVEVVDTVGAGDSFTAALCASLLKGHSLRQAHRIAVDTAAFVCTQAGAMPSYENMNL